ncbi:transposase [Candidatus Magnetomoraceae bacterium gMMP-15]
MSELSSPHDKFFSEVFDRPEVGRDFLRNYLPVEIAEHIDFDSLELTKDSFIDKKLKKYFSDKLYKVKFSNGINLFFYTLVEHKSYAEKFVSFQLLQYIVRIWESVIKKHEAEKEEARKKRKQGKQVPEIEPLKSLPPIIPIVLYHGASKWKIPYSFKSLIDSKTPVGLDKYIPDFEYLLCDLSEYSDSEIKGVVIYQIGMLILKYIFRQELKERLPGILRMLNQLGSKQTALEYLETIIEYLVKGTDKFTEKELGNALESALPETGGDFMLTLADKWLNEGRKNTLLDVIKYGLKQKFGDEGLKLITEIHKIQDINVLEEVSKGLWSINNLNELCQIYR